MLIRTAGLIRQSRPDGNEAPDNDASLQPI